jgi:cell division protein FtsB
MAQQRRGFLERRGAAALLLVLFIAGGLIFVFAGTLARATELESEAAAARADVAVLERRVEAGLAEIEFIKSDTFTSQAGRGVGYGEEGETPFRLPADAPPPADIPLLGLGGSDAGDLTALEAWLRLLFET